MASCPEYPKTKTWGAISDIEYYDTKGRCCCNCQHQRPINAHPWNESEFASGSIMKVIGWGCHAPEFFPKITFFERGHGFCECYTERTYKDTESTGEIILPVNQ